MQSLQTAEIPTDAVCKTVTVHESEFEVEMLYQRMNTNQFLQSQRVAWYQEKGYTSQNDYPVGAYGPYLHETTIIRFWKSKQDAEDWIQLTRQFYQACGIADSEVHIELVEI